jgi:hypothetical protein
LPLIAFLNERAPWLFGVSLDYFSNYALILGATCTALHLAIAALGRWMGSQAPVASSAQALAAPPVRITER